MVVNCATVGLDRIARPAEVGRELEPPSGIFLRRPRKGKCREGTSGIEQPFYVPIEGVQRQRVEVRYAASGQ